MDPLTPAVAAGTFVAGIGAGLRLRRRLPRAEVTGSGTAYQTGFDDDSAAGPPISTRAAAVAGTGARARSTRPTASSAGPPSRAARRW